MLTVTLRSESASLLLCTVNGHEQAAYDTVADMAWRPLGNTAAEFRTRLAGALVSAALDVNAYPALDLNGLTTDFDRVTVVDGDLVTDFPLWGGPTFGYETVPRDADGKWTSGPGGGHGSAVKHHDAGFLEGAGKGPRTHAQAQADRERIAKELDEFPDPTIDRARILAQLDDQGDASTVAEFDRIDGDKWTPERTAQHEQIIADWMAAAKDVPRNHLRARTDRHSGAFGTDGA